MEYDTRVSAEFAGAKLDKLVNRVHRDTLALVETADIPAIVKHFDAVRVEYDALYDKVSKLKAEIDELSYNIIPTMFNNQSVKTIKIEGVGRTTVNVRWSASVQKEVGMSGALDWCRSTGNEGLIIETINSSTLSAFAKTQALDGKPLPDNVFNVTQLNYVSITKK